MYLDVGVSLVAVLGAGGVEDGDRYELLRASNRIEAASVGLGVGGRLRQGVVSVGEVFRHEIVVWEESRSRQLLELRLGSVEAEVGGLGHVANVIVAFGVVDKLGGDLDLLAILLPLIRVLPYIAL